MREVITIYSTDVKHITRNYYENFMPIFLTDEIGKFLKRHKLPKLKQEDTVNLNSPISLKKLNFYLETSPQRKFQTNSLMNSARYLRRK